MLIDHGINDVRERFVAREQAMASGEQVALQPALAQVFREHLKYPTIATQMIVCGQNRCAPLLVRYIEDVPELVRFGFVWTEKSEVSLSCVIDHQLSQIPAQNPGRRGGHSPGPARHHTKSAGIGQDERFQYGTAVGMRIGSHSPVT
ncbi:Uncharacterised protein [Mycobacteroides abscessus subsp. abscessus]|nr:Uncharacterised protein [Mycobacteroides abscessus subsp. abscessus]